MRSLVNLNKPLVSGFWVPRKGKDSAWVSVKYERLQIFCYSCGRLGHEGRTCKNFSSGSEDGDKRKVFGSWLSASGVQTLEEVVEVCRPNWCEAPAEQNRTGKNHYRRSWSPEEIPSNGGKKGPRIMGCQDQSGLGKEIVCHPVIGMSKSIRRMVHPMKVRIQNTKSMWAKHEKCNLEMRLPPQVDPIDISDGSPLSEQADQLYHVEFPGDPIPIQNPPAPHGGLSPISAMAEFSLVSRPLSLSHHAVENQSQRSGRKSYRSVKASLRNKKGEHSLNPQAESLVVTEIDFPASCLNGDGVPAVDQSSSSSAQNAGGWMGPATGAP
ncbi:hypothetical protein K1719_041349 [Acacia pycnantha]|nr:hypothetical protein K1719_041349 [Acacia pycnantha]